ncbi:50S ribosomal protein L28 [Candidatus Vidania fulgoroideae]|nr:50S ribosomal protein L28 [Candidatus Vidania fulgoroideae]
MKKKKTKKKPLFGNKVSKSKKKIRRKFKTNKYKKTFSIKKKEAFNK